MKTLKTLTISILLVLSAFSCKDKDEVADYLATNRWIKDTMEEVYLWEKRIPSGLRADENTDPFDFFQAFVYEKEDHWSYLSDDYYETENLYNGIVTTAGYEFSLSFIGNSNNICGIVEYVLPNTPAAELDIRRGDIFTHIDGQALNLDNYLKLLFQGGTYSVSFALLDDNEQLVLKETKTLTEIEDYSENPVFLDSIYHIGGKVIAYLVYNGFVDEYDKTDVERVFTKFKSAGVTDLIMDLRYNLGGDVSSEENLANIIAPTSALDEIFSKEVWNDLYNAYFKEKYGDDYLNTRIKAHPCNINLSGKLIGLTSSMTASASEGLLNGLAPLTDFVQIGDTTHGKYTAMVVLPDNERNPQWAIVPIVMKTTNKNDVSVKGGMAPHVLLANNPLDGYPLGDIRETLLARAIAEITGIVPLKTRMTVRPTFTGEEIGRYKHGGKLKPLPRMVSSLPMLLE